MMEESRLTTMPAFIVLPAFWAGLYDMINPCYFASAMVFLMYLAIAGVSQVHVLFLGLLFIVSTGLMDFALAMGIMDVYLTSSFVLFLIYLFYFILSVAFLLRGFINLTARINPGRFREGARLFRFKLPVFFEGPERLKGKGLRERIIPIIEHVLMAIIGGFVLAAFSAVFPQREYIFILHSYLMAGGKTEFFLQSVVQYSLASLAPLALVWFCVIILGFLRKRPKAVQYYQSISAALYFAVGAGLMYFLLMQTVFV